MTSRLDSGVEVRRVLHGTSGLGSYRQPTSTGHPYGSPISHFTNHPNVVAENVMALTVLSGLEGAPTLSDKLPSTLSRKAPVVRPRLARDSTYGNLPESTRASTRGRQAAARETDPNQ